MSEAFANNWEYLDAELARLNLLIRAEVARCRWLVSRDRPDSFRGMFISEGEVDQLLGASDQQQGSGEVEHLRTQADAAHEEIWQRQQAAGGQGVYLSLPHLAQIFRLTPLEKDLILICLAPEIDLKYQPALRLFAG